MLRKHLFFTLITILITSANLSAQTDFFSEVRQGDLEAAELSIKENAEVVNISNLSGYSPLLIAVYNGRFKMAKLLIENGANINENTKQGSALHASIHKGNIAVSLWLIEQGIDVNLLDGNKQNALIFSVLYKQKAVAQALLEHGANSLQKDNSQLSALDYAKELELTDIIELLENN